MFVIVNDLKVFALRQMYLMFVLKNKGMLTVSWTFFFSCFKLICWTENEKYFSLRVLFYMWNFVLVDIVASSLVGFFFLWMTLSLCLTALNSLIHFIGSLRNQISRNRRFPPCWAEPNYTWSARQNHPGKILCGGLISWPHLVIIGPIQS